MIATNTVKINGILYRAGDEIPCLINSVKDEIRKENKVENKVEKPVEIPKVLQEPTRIEELANKVKSTRDIPKYTKAQITKLRTNEVRDLGTRLGIDNCENKSNAQIKREIMAMVEERYGDED